MKMPWLAFGAATGVVCAMLFAPAAQAEGPSFELARSPLQCLVAPDRAELRYPQADLERKLGGIVRVRLSFTSATAEPRAEVFFSSGDGFRDAALDFTAKYRLPCLVPSDGTVIATQEFSFEPGDGRRVIWSDLRDSSADKSRFSSCMTGPSRLPDYPRSMLGGPTQGVVFARYTFTNPSGPPKVEILYDGGSARFARVAEDYGADLRLPCMTSGNGPVIAQQQFRFHLDGDKRSALKDAALPAFVGALDRLESLHVRFDFNTMGCPFEVRFVLRQPYLDNEVGELERRDPNRREFIEWLKHVDFKMSNADRRQVLGDSMTISVPCSILDLT